jgi:hydroxymethylbilane synthase
VTRKIVFGSRKSKLALAQTNWVIEELRKRWPDVEFEIRTITTTGDRIMNKPLSTMAGKGVFVKEIEEALLSGEVDLAVHSMKDLPTEQPEGLTIASVPGRADPRDVLVQAKGKGLGDLPQGSRIGTSSLRRTAQVRNLRPDLTIADIRGNVDTRLRKVEEGLYAATILAAAGLKRLGWLARASYIFEPEEFLSAPGQGALGIEVREDDHFACKLAASRNVDDANQAVLAERTFLAALGGGCKVPIGALGRVDGQQLTLYGMVASPDGGTLLRDEVEGEREEAEALGRALAENLKRQGAEELLALETDVAER